MSGGWTKGFLIDKSALVRLHPVTHSGAIDLIQRGLVRVTSLTLLEVGYSGRRAEEVRTLRDTPPLALMPVEYLTPAAEDRAIEVQALLAERGQHRAPSIPDLLIAATAELAGLTVLAMDKDYDLIADVTGQPVRWLD